MKATVKRTDMLAVLRDVTPALPGRSVLPACETVLLTARGKALGAAVHDLEVGLAKACPATVEKAGAIAVRPRALCSFLKAVDVEDISLSLAKDKLTVQAGTASISLEGMKAEDFPPIPTVNARPVTAPGLADALKEIAHAIAQDESRPVLNGVCLTPKEDRIELAAADGFRLAIVSARARGKLKGQAIVPLKAVKLVMKLMEGTVTICYDQDANVITFQSGELHLVARTTQGTFPNYALLVPKGGKSLNVDADALRKAHRAVAAIEPQSNIIRLLGKNGNLTVSARDADEAESSAVVPAQGTIKIAADSRYLKDLFDRLDGSVTLKSKSPSDPFKVTHKGVIHVTMPMFVQW